MRLLSTVFKSFFKEFIGFPAFVEAVIREGQQTESLFKELSRKGSEVLFQHNMHFATILSVPIILYKAATNEGCRLCFPFRLIPSSFISLGLGRRTEIEAAFSSLPMKLYFPPSARKGILYITSEAPKKA